MKFKQLASTEEAFEAAIRKTLWVMKRDRLIKATGFKETAVVEPENRSINRSIHFCAGQSGLKDEHWGACEISELHVRIDE